MGLIMLNGVAYGGGQAPIATPTEAGIVKPDGTTITVDANGVISSSSTTPEGVLYTDTKIPETPDIVAITADKAVADGDGNVISATYATKDELSAESADTETALATKLEFTQTASSSGYPVVNADNATNDGTGANIASQFASVQSSISTINNALASKGENITSDGKLYFYRSGNTVTISNEGVASGNYNLPFTPRNYAISPLMSGNSVVGRMEIAQLSNRIYVSNVGYGHITLVV